LITLFSYHKNTYGAGMILIPVYKENLRYKILCNPPMQNLKEICMNIDASFGRQGTIFVNKMIDNKIMHSGLLNDKIFHGF